MAAPLARPDAAADLASAPSALIVLPLEGRPQVRFDALHLQEEFRIRAWLNSSGLMELVDRAYELAAEEPAA